MPLTERLWPKVVWTDYDCWEWQGAKTRGYGVMNVRSGTRLVHRLVYEMLVGPIPEGMQLDHLCRNTKCCAPWHLEPVTPLENSRRGIKASAEVCQQGHDRWGIHAGRRYCMECHRLRVRANYVKKTQYKWNRYKTHCIHGHAFTPENTYVRADTGARQCKECGRTRQRNSQPTRADMFEAG